MEFCYNPSRVGVLWEGNITWFKKLFSGKAADNGDREILSSDKENPVVPTEPETVDPALGHDFQSRDVCETCGNSRGAILKFGWKCEAQEIAEVQQLAPNIREGRITADLITCLHIYHADDIAIGDDAVFAAQVYRSVNPAVIEAFVQAGGAPDFNVRPIPRAVIADISIFINNLTAQMGSNTILLQPVQTSVSNAGDVIVLTETTEFASAGSPATIVALAKEIQPV